VESVSEREPRYGDPTRRTWLAAERTWLAWWRSGIAVGAVALAVGRFFPTLTHGARWPFRVLGIAYGLLSVVIFVVGAVRQRHAAEALRRGEFEELTPSLVMWLTAGAVLLSVGATLLVAVEL
jgi:putative membrane protein